MASLVADARVLAKAVERLQALTNVGDDSKCAVPDEAKEAVRLYVDTWVTPAIEAVLADIKGETPLPHWMRQP